MAPTKSNTPKGEKDLYETPDSTLNLLNMLYGPFTVDLFANAENHKFPIWFGPDSPVKIFDTFEQHVTHSGLVSGFKAFGNPPYSAGYVPNAVYLAYRYAVLGYCSSTLLIPARTDQDWWGQYVWNNNTNAPYSNVEIFFFPYRIKFIRPNGEIAANPTDASVAITFRCK